MPQDSYNKNDKRRLLPKFNKNSSDGDNNTPRKGPRFSFYWVYAIIFAVLIGFQLFGGPFSPNSATITQENFENMLAANDVAEYTIISNRNQVKVTLNKDAISKYSNILGGKVTETQEGPHAQFNVPSVEFFSDD